MAYGLVTYHDTPQRPEWLRKEDIPFEKPAQTDPAYKKWVMKQLLDEQSY